MRPAPSVRLSLVVLALVGLGAATSGCKTGSPLHSRYNNFRAYYNTYYNAERSLEEGEGALERSAVTVDRNRLVAVFPVTSSAGQSGPFQDAIDKSADLLRERPSSKWADDALLVIGKAYFYQRNFAGAEQKFRETMAAADAIGDDRLAGEARFWLGRTYAAANRFEEGVGVLEEGLADEDGDQRWRPQMQLALGELYARAGRWDEAAEDLRAGAPREGDADVAARAYVLLGQVEEHAGRWDEAVAAYAEALRRRPAYELAYAAQVGRALVTGFHAGTPDEGLAAVRAMRSDDKNYDRRGELALVEARLLVAAGQEARALALFRDVLYDEALAGQAVRGEAHYRLAEFYRDARGDYVRASAHFDTAATALRAPDLTVRPARGAILDVGDEAQTYRSLAETARQIAAADSLLLLGDLSEEDFEARIADIEAERLRVYREEQRRLQEARTAEEFSGSADVIGPGASRNPNSQADRLAQQQAAADAGFLAYRSPPSVQAGLISFEQRWGDRPLVPNWRRRAAIQAGDVASGRGVIDGRAEGGIGPGEGPPPLDLSQVPRTPAKRAELVTELAGLRYELANAFFLSLGRADTAAALYQTILDETPDVPVAVRARYALAEIERAAGREDAARPLYESVAEADSAALGRASRVRLGLEDEAVPAAPAPESSPAYDAARQRWTRGDPLGAAEALVTLADADPDADVAPRAYLAAAVAYAEWAGTDSTALVRPLPDSLVSPVLLAVADSLSQAEMAAAVRAYEAAQAAAAAAEQAAAAARAAADSTGAPADSTTADLVAPDAPLDDEIDSRPGDDLDDDLDAPVDDDSPAQSIQVGEGEFLPVQRPARRAPSDSDEDLPAFRSDRPAAPPARPLASPPTDPAAGAEPAAPVRTALPPVDSTSFTLRHHLRAVAARYPGTPSAVRAADLVLALPALPPFDPSELPDRAEPRPDSLRQPLADSAGVAAGDSLAAPPAPVSDSTATPDSTAQPALADDAEPVPPGRFVDDDESLDVEDDAVPALDLPPSVALLRGDEPLDPGEGGYTWRVRTLSIPDEGAQVVGVLRDAGFRTAVLREADGGAYAIVIGRFGSEAEAEAARQGLPAWAQLRGEVVALGGFEALPESEPAPDDGP